MYKYILFDLDGTLTESAPGIINSIKYTYRHYGIENYDEAELSRFVGPPLIESFMKFAGFSESRAREAVDVYREYFREKGMFENSVYPGVRECLQRLKDKGFALAVATSKPEPFCLKILEHFSLLKFFDVVKGIPLDGEDMTKSEVVSAALHALSPENLSEAVMVGDRDYDVIGAKENGLECLGVLYGYGSRDELLNAGALEVFETAEDLCDFLTGEA